MTDKIHIRDKQAKGDEPKVLERFSVDAAEIVAMDPERYEIIGKAPPSSPGSTTAVLDNDPPTEVARKVLEAAGVKQPVPEGQSEEVAEQDVHGNAVDAPANGAAAAKPKKGGKKAAAEESKA